MKENLIPSPPKWLIVFFGIISLFSLLMVLLGKYGFSSVDMGKVLYKVNCSFYGQDKGKAEKVAEEFKAQSLDVEIVSKVVYKTENKGFIVAVTYQLKDREFLANQTKKVLESNGYPVKVFSPDTNPNVTIVQIGPVYRRYEEAVDMAKKVLNKAAIKCSVEVNKIIKGKETVYTVIVRTRDKFLAEDYNTMLSKKGYMSEITTEKL
ncbi:MAG: hypothetical protein ABRQ39_15460 [Candidatus Eremiobacterota bacterium]